ncbi:Uu.00g077140.m01.CDS01 [Anthostomella pinea]|uniref:Uu.00g077140.m01.CDS01 n=1 Tax=Anthostomella pinea TaxID=933095 RepID=A0AAI8VWQ2_9PEZI|nr:Uu.00g077140.m01.CDS01 [Anthostomella pinea]
MRDFWNYPGCVGLMVLAILTGRAGANLEDEYQVLRLEKNHNIFRHPKREASCEMTDWSFCPASVGGGCCPNNFECDVSSCYATTAGPTTACGHVGWYSCPLTAGAGTCCRVGYICDPNGGCPPPAGVSVTQTCPTSYFACPASLGFGCCQDGKICGSGVCYDSTPTTLPVSDTTTITNSNGDTITTIVTSMVVITPGPDISSSAAGVAAVPKLVPSTVSKMDSVETGSSSGGSDGLSSSALGGIVAGVVVVLVAITVAACFIIMRLKKTERAAKAAEAAAESRRESSSGQQRSHKPGFGRPSVSEVDGTVDIDPLSIMRPSPQFRSRSDSSAGNRSRSRTPDMRGSGTSSPPAWPGPYNPAPVSDASDGRQSSQSSYAQQEARYGQQSPPLGRVSYESQTSNVQRHTRKSSDASELDGVPLSELDTLEASEAASRRRSSSATRPTRANVRRSSDPSGHSRGRGDSVTAAKPPLHTVSETFELHGHYGPHSLVAGQTAARLSRSTASSAPNYGPE